LKGYCRCTPYPGPRSVIVLDNCVIHRGRELKEACDTAGVRLEFLPAYSPDYNPIEMVFHVLKEWIRKNIELARGFETFGQFLQHAIEISGAGRYAEEHFRHCGYIFYESDEEDSNTFRTGSD